VTRKNGPGGTGGKCGSIRLDDRPCEPERMRKKRIDHQQKLKIDDSCERRKAVAETHQTANKPRPRAAKRRNREDQKKETGEEGDRGGAMDLNRRWLHKFRKSK